MYIINIKKLKEANTKEYVIYDSMNYFVLYEDQKSRKNKSTLLLVKTVITLGGWVVTGQGHSGCS